MLLVFVEFCDIRIWTIAEQNHEHHLCLRDRYTYIYISPLFIRLLMDDVIDKDLEKMYFETQIQAILIEAFCK